MLFSITLSSGFSISTSGFGGSYAITSLLLKNMYKPMQVTIVIINKTAYFVISLVIFFSCVSSRCLKQYNIKV